jgi:hypothetical protein
MDLSSHQLGWAPSPSRHFDSKILMENGLDSNRIQFGFESNTAGFECIEARSSGDGGMSKKAAVGLGPGLDAAASAFAPIS